MTIPTNVMAYHRQQASHAYCDLVQANRSGFHPRLDERTCFLLCAGSRSPAVSGHQAEADIGHGNLGHGN
jgi:hypothetical protein